MSLSDAFEAEVLALYYHNSPIANIGDAAGILGSAVAGNLFVRLHTADPGEAGTAATNETAYTNYAGGVAVARSVGGWTLSGTSPTQIANAATVTFPACGATGATLTHFSVCAAAAGAALILHKGALTAPLIVNNGIVPSFAPGLLVNSQD
jgi:hypothetical protein